MKRLMIIGAALLLAAGCADVLENEPAVGGETFVVSFEPPTRIQLDEGQHPVWNEGDLLSVYNYRNANEQWRFCGRTGDTQGVIEQSEALDAGIPLDRIIVAYPYRKDYVLSPDAGTISTMFSSVQTYLEGSYGLNDNVLVYSGTGSGIILKNVFGWLKFQFVGSVPIMKIELSGNGGEQLNGPVDINYETNEVSFRENNAGDRGGTITLDCGEEGVALNSAQAVPFYIAVVPGIFENGFTIKVTGKDGSVMTRKVEKRVVIERNVIKPFAELQFGSINLSSEGTANSYIVSKAGYYTFRAVQGNSGKSVGEVAGAEVLWETFGTDKTPDVGDLVSDVRYSDGTIYFKASDMKGNASIAAKDAAGNILWSWHIWMTDKPSDQVYRNGAGIMMDRNLGAVSAVPGDAGALGLLYQWGRKDPFIGSSSVSSPIAAKSTLISWPTTSSTASTGTVAYAVAHPTTIITYNTYNTDWYYTGDVSTDDTRWQSAKTVYDPCPYGYRVPDGGVDGIWAVAFGTSEYIYEMAYDSVKEGYNFGRSDKTPYLTEDADCWYPAAGYRCNVNGSLRNVGANGFYRSCTTKGKDAAYLSFNEAGRVAPTVNDYRAYSLSVRCLRE